MLSIIKSLVYYIPGESLDKMIKSKVYSLSRLNPLSQSYQSTIQLRVVENQVDQDKIETSSDPKEILQYILDEFEESYISKNYKDKDDLLSFDKSQISNSNYLNKKIFIASNIIYQANHVGPGNVVLIPEEFKSLVTLTANMEVVVNPLPSNKIYVISRPKDITQCKFILMTDSTIPHERELKINKLTGVGNREINHSMIKVNGHNKSVVVFQV